MNFYSGMELEGEEIKVLSTRNGVAGGVTIPSYILSITRWVL